MRKSLLILFGSLCLGTGAFAQSANLQIDQEKATGTHVEARLATGQKLIVSPNPVKQDAAVLNIDAVGIDIYSYRVFDMTGSIVELENLSGRPDISILDLTGAVELGSYFISFETNVGKITRKIMVI